MHMADYGLDRVQSAQENMVDGQNNRNRHEQIKPPQYYFNTILPFHLLFCPSMEESPNFWFHLGKYKNNKVANVFIILK